MDNSDRHSRRVRRFSCPARFRSARPAPRNIYIQLTNERRERPHRQTLVALAANQKSRTGEPRSHRAHEKANFMRSPNSRVVFHWTKWPLFDLLTWRPGPGQPALPGEPQTERRTKSPIDERRSVCRLQLPLIASQLIST